MLIKLALLKNGGMQKMMLPELPAQGVLARH